MFAMCAEVIFFGSVFRGLPKKRPLILGSISEKGCGVLSHELVAGCQQSIRFGIAVG